MVTVTRIGKQETGSDYRVVRDSLGIPKIEIGIDSFDIIMAMDTGDDRALIQEKRLLLVECLMLTGEKRQTVVAKKLEINRHTARKCIRQIEFRWSTKPSQYFRRARGESKQRLNLINRELGLLVDSPESSDRIRATAISRLLHVHDRLMVVDGITPSVLAESARPYLRGDACGSPPEMSAAERIQEHQRLIELIGKMQSFLRQQAQDENQKHAYASGN